MYLLQMIVYQIQYKLLHIITIKTEIIINYIYSLQSQSLYKHTNLQMILFHWGYRGFFN